MTKPQPPSSIEVAAVVFRRWFDAPKDVVYSVWSNPDHIKHWLHPSPEWSNPVVEVDLRVGGRYRLGFQHPGERDVVFVVGRFLEVEHSERLVYTWTWEPPDPHAGFETVVTVEFTSVDGGTAVSLTHERFPDDERRQRHAEGWSGALDCLTDHLGTL